MPKSLTPTESQWLNEFENKFYYSPGEGLLMNGVKRQRESPADPGKEVYWGGENASLKDIKDFLLSFSTAIRQEAVAEREREIVEMTKEMEQELPKRKCLNVENNLFGKCFECEKTKGYNQALSDIIQKLKS